MFNSVLQPLRDDIVADPVSFVDIDRYLFATVEAFCLQIVKKHEVTADFKAMVDLPGRN